MRLESLHKSVGIYTLLLIFAIVSVSVAGDGGPINLHLVKKAPKEVPAPMPHIISGQPDKQKIKQDETTEAWRTLRDQKREPGPIDIQRYQLNFEPTGPRTFFQLPVAMTQEDLKAGKVDIAIFGAPSSALPHSHGSIWAPMAVRGNRDYGGYGGDKSFPLGWIEYETLINPFETLTAVDYGDAGVNPYFNASVLEEIRRITREIAETGAIPFAVGGDHAVPNGTFRGIVDVYGRKNVGFVHFDVHLDRGTGKMGAFYHGGSYMTLAVQEGLVEGRHVVQFGMGSPSFGESLYDEVLKEGGKVYHLHEIRRDGVETIYKKMLKDLEDIELIYISFDVDVFDMSYAPGTGSSEPTGMTPNELFPIMRKLAATKSVVGFDVVEFNPFYDNRGEQTARLVRRIMLQFLTGIAMKERGMDPDYIHPRVSGKP